MCLLKLKIIDNVQIMEINGKSEDALAYYKYKQNGLNVIAVGGDKLSRGLTLEGLSITYYYRNTLMYDTLMQMEDGLVIVKDIWTCVVYIHRVQLPKILSILLKQW